MATILTDGTGTDGLTKNIKGLILFPDEYIGPTSNTSDITWDIINTDYSGKWGTTCTTAGWETLKNAGCVFLPAAGLRDGTNTSNIGTRLLCWTTIQAPSEANRALALSTSDYDVDYWLPCAKFCGYSVRLVKNVPAEEKIASVTAAPASIPDLTYTGSAQALVTTGTAQHGTMEYSLDGETWNEDIPTGTYAGEYQVYYRAKGVGCFTNSAAQSNVVTIAQADYTPSGSYSVIGNDLSFTGSAQNLVTASNESDGTIWYKLGDGDWSDQIPTAEEIGTYHVWYKVVPSDAVNYKSTDPVEVIASITIPTVYDVNIDPSSLLTTLYNGGSPTATTLKVIRTIVANGEYNTLCLPFSLDESALAASPLAGFDRLKTFRGAQVTGTAPDLYIDIFVEDATTIEAGIPYLITYPSAHADIVDPVFNSITVTRTEPDSVSADGVTFVGMFAQRHIDPYTSAARNEDYLFLGANSQLMWPASTQTSSSIKMRGFRAFFKIDRTSITPALAPKGTRARIVDAPKTTTGIDELNATTCTKLIENGQLIILKNGIKYNAQGQVVK